MSETFEFDGMYRGMGEIVDDDGVGESLYHYAEAPAQQQRQQPRQRRAANASVPQQRVDLSDDDLSGDAPPAPRPATTTPAPVATVAPQRGLKTPVILGLSAGALAAASVYGYLRWKRPDEESPAKLAGVAGGVSGVGVLITILAARGAGMLDRGQAKV